MREVITGQTGDQPTEMLKRAHYHQHQVGGELEQIQFLLGPRLDANDEAVLGLQTTFPQRGEE